MDLRRLTPADAPDYRALMLATYADASAVFAATVAEREPLPIEWWAARLSDQPDPDTLVLGAFVDDRLAGAVGLWFERRERTRHKATLFGLAVRPEARGRGIARTLVQALLDQARAAPGVRVVQLTVAEPNQAARRLYTSCGFEAFGTEPLGLRIDGRFVPLVHMTRAVR